MTHEPGYVALARRGELRARAEAAWARLAACDLCPRRCGSNRLEGEVGFCRTGKEAVVCSFHPHFGEEPPLVGRHGSGTIFFSWCNLRCQYCQNFEISQRGEGAAVSAATLARMMLELQHMGCHNVNLVSPSHVVPQVLSALAEAVSRGLRIPVVYNTGGYDALDTLALLDGVIDIYMPDMKYADAEVARQYSDAADYPQVNRAAVKAMHRQVGDLEVDGRGVATRGLLVRHLVLPDGLAGTEATVAFLADQVSDHTFLNVMDQYRPCYRAKDLPAINRRITPLEYAHAAQRARERLHWP